MDLKAVICNGIGHLWQGKPHVVNYKDNVWMVYEDRCRRCGHKMDFLERFL